MSVSKKELVYENLKARIIGNELQQGMPIIETDYALELGVSKTPIREALRMLEREGLIENTAGRGSIVSYISSRKLHDVFQLREIVEAGSAKRASALPNKQIFIDKYAVITGLLEEVEGQSLKVEEWSDFEDIHLIIVQSLENSELLDIYRDLLNSIRRIRECYKNKFTVRRLKDILNEHLKIIESIINGNAEDAEKEMITHLRKAGEFIDTITFTGEEILNGTCIYKNKQAGQEAY